MSRIELDILLEIVWKKDKEGNVIKTKEVVQKRVLSIGKLEGPFQVLNSKGKPMNKRCIVYHDDLGLLEVKNKYYEIKEVLERGNVSGYNRS